MRTIFESMKIYFFPKDDSKLDCSKIILEIKDFLHIEENIYKQSTNLSESEFVYCIFAPT